MTGLCAMGASRVVNATCSQAGQDVHGWQPAPAAHRCWAGCCLLLSLTTLALCCCLEEVYIEGRAPLWEVIIPRASAAAVWHHTWCKVNPTYPYSQEQHQPFSHLQLQAQDEGEGQGDAGRMPKDISIPFCHSCSRCKPCFLPTSLA